jgi:hypothetical protein
MIHTKPEFFNTVVQELNKKYYPTVKYYRDNDDCVKMHYIVELFNNGALTYKELVNRLSKNCKDTNKNIHDIVSKFIISFGSYKPLFRK